MHHVSVKIQTEPRHQSVITRHTSTCRTDTSTLSEVLSFTCRSRETESKGKNIKKLPKTFLLIISFLPPQTLQLLMNNQKDYHITAGHPILLLRGPRVFLLFFLRICYFTIVYKSHQSANFIVQMRGQGQVSFKGSPERRGPGLAVPCGRHPHPTCSSASPKTRDALEVSSLFARTLGSLRGVRYPLQEALSSGQWLMKSAWWQVLMSSPGLVRGTLLHC